MFYQYGYDHVDSDNFSRLLSSESLYAIPDIKSTFGAWIPVPDNTIFLLDNIKIGLITDQNVANRRAIVQVSQVDGNLIWAAVADYVQPASLEWFHFFVRDGHSTVVTSVFNTIRLPTLPVMGGYRVQTFIENLQAGDVIYGCWYNYRILELNR